MTLVELMIGLALIALMSMAVMAMMNYMNAGTQGARRQDELSSLMTNLRLFLSNQVNCTQNLQGTIVPIATGTSTAAPVPINSTNQLTYQTGPTAGQVFIRAAWNYPGGNGPLYINGNGGTNPGLALQYKGTLTTNAANNGGTELVDFVVNASKSSPVLGSPLMNAAAVFGSPMMTSRLPLVVSVDGSGKVLDCFAQSGVVGKYIMDDICASENGGAFSPSLGACVSNCYLGNTNTASCPGGMQVSSCGSSGGSDPHASLYQASPYPGAPAYGFGNVQTQQLSPTSCYCAWATDLPSSDYGQCEACCVPI